MNRPSLLHTHRKLLLRMVLLPVGLLLILGFLFSRTFIENIPFAIVDQDNSSLSRTIVRQFRLHPGFRIDTYLDSEKSLQEAIRTKQVLGRGSTATWPTTSPRPSCCSSTGPTSSSPPSPRATAAPS